MAVAECFLLDALSLRCRAAAISDLPINECDNPKARSTLSKYIYSPRHRKSLFLWAFKLHPNKSPPPFNLLPWETDLHFWVKASNATSSQTNSKCITPDLFPFKMAATGEESFLDIARLLHPKWSCGALIILMLFFLCVKSSKLDCERWKKGMNVWVYNVVVSCCP